MTARRWWETIRRPVTSKSFHSICSCPTSAGSPEPTLSRSSPVHPPRSRPTELTTHVSTLSPASRISAMLRFSTSRHPAHASIFVCTKTVIGQPSTAARSRASSAPVSGAAESETNSTTCACCGVDVAPTAGTSTRSSRDAKAPAGRASSRADIISASMSADLPCR